MAFLFVQSVQVASGGTSSLVVPIAATGLKNLVVVDVKIGSTSSAISSIVDNVGNVYGNVIGPYSNSSIICSQISGVQLIAGATSVTINFTVSTPVRATVSEASGGKQTNATVFNTSAFTIANNVNTTLSPVLAPSLAGELICSSINFATSPGSVTVAPGYTFGTSGLSQATQYKLAGTTSETANAVLGAAVDFIHIAGAYIPFTAPSVTILRKPVDRLSSLNNLSNLTRL